MKVKKTKANKKRLMYNEEQKKEYINYLGSYQDNLRNFFERLYEKESEYKKDIADMSDPELMDALVSLNVRSENTRSHLLSFYKGYVDWARLYGKTTNNSSIKMISAASIGSKNAVLSQMIGCPEHLAEILEGGMIKGETEQFLMPNRAARDQLVFWLIYSGMTLNELCDLKKTDINISEMTVVTDAGKTYPVSHKIISLWKETCSMLYLERKNGKATAKKKPETGEVVKFYLVENEYLFRPIKGSSEHDDKVFTDRAFAVIIYRTLKQYMLNTGKTIRLTPENIRSSGIFYRLYQTEKSGVEITSRMLIDNFSLNDTEKETKDKLLPKLRKLQTDYEDWKLAFNYGIIYEED